MAWVYSRGERSFGELGCVTVGSLVQSGAWRAAEPGDRFPFSRTSGPTQWDRQADWQRLQGTLSAASLWKADGRDLVLFRDYRR